MPPGHLKVGKKTTKGQHQPGNTLHPLELQRLKQVMANNARLHELGLPGYCTTGANAHSIRQSKKKPSFRNRADSESEYDPSENDTGEDLLVDDSDQGLKDCNMRTTNMPTAGIKLCSKRVFAEREFIRTTRSKKTTAQSDAAHSPRDVHVPSPTRVNQATEVFGDNDGCTQASAEADGPAHFDECTRMTNEENGNIQVDDILANGGEAIVEPSVDSQMGNEDTQLGENDQWEMGVNMGHGLQRMNRAMRGKLPVVIPEGRIRPVAPLVAAKFATECNITVRNHIPVFKHWKDYKNSKGLFDLFTEKINAKFNINISNAPVQKARSQMMKNAVRQQRHKLKKKYFDPFPLHLVTKTSPIKSMSDKEWNDLVEYWKSPKKMETSQKNKDNRSKVKFHQTTGSRSYMVHVENLGDKYIDEEPNALDLFKECHYSKKKKCYTSTVQQVITEMENKLSTPTEGEQCISVTDAVANVLAENTKKNLFLQNVGIQNAVPRSSVRSIEAQLEVEKRANSDLRSVVNDQRGQLEALSKQVQQTEESRIREQEEVKKRQAEMEAKLQCLLSQIHPS